VAILEINQKASWDGSSGVIIGPIEVQSACLNSALYVQASTIATTGSFSLQTSPSSAGPWVTEGSTSISASASATSMDVLRLTGPFQFVRGYATTKSTGTHFATFIGVG
jgi:hypothetical protein